MANTQSRIILVPIDPTVLSAAAKSEIVSGFASLLGVDISGDTDWKHTDGDEDPQVFDSYPITPAQAGKVFLRLNEQSTALLRRFAECYDSDSRSSRVPWPEARQIMGDHPWPRFAKGFLSGLTRRLRRVTGSKDGLLIIESEDDWKWNDEIKDYCAGELVIDGPAIESIKKYFNI